MSARIAASPCHASLYEFQRRWLALFQAVGARNAPRMAELASQLLATQNELGADAREYLVLAALAGHLASGDKVKALEAWGIYGPTVRPRPVFRLLRCHAALGGCVDAFRAYAER